MMMRLTNKTISGRPPGLAVRRAGWVKKTSLAAFSSFAFWIAGQDAWAGPILLEHVPSGRDVASPRTEMFNEGYLEYAVNPVRGRFGHEWTGWNDARHPSLVGPRDAQVGYDRSDRWVQVGSTILTSRTGAIAEADRVNDFHFANKAYMLQAGVFPVEASIRGVDSAQVPGGFGFPLTVPVELNIMNAQNRGAPLIENYYAQSLASGALGETTFPSINSPGLPPNPAAFPDGIFMGNIVPGSLPPRNVGNDAFGHELFHFASDGRAVHQEIPDNPATPANESVHSGDSKNIVFPFVTRPLFEQVGPILSATVGGKMQITKPQTERMFDATTGFAPYFPANQKKDFPQHGHRVDWDFVTDQAMFTQATPSEPFTDLNGDGMFTPGEPFSDFGADGIAGTGDSGEGDGVFTPSGVKSFGLEDAANGADRFKGEDSLYWKIGTTVASPETGVTGAGIAATQTGHDHAGMGVFGPKPDFAGPFFRVADVFSLSLRYSDSDTDGLGNLSLREGALDYDVFFVDAMANLSPGILHKVFIPGWSDASAADNFLGRWRSPVDAVALFITTHTGGGHDFTTQIDAVIVAAEPSSLILLLVGIGALGWRVRRNK